MRITVFLALALLSTSAVAVDEQLLDRLVVARARDGHTVVNGVLNVAVTDATIRADDLLSTLGGDALTRVPVQGHVRDVRIVVDVRSPLVLTTSRRVASVTQEAGAVASFDGYGDVRLPAGAPVRSVHVSGSLDDIRALVALDG